MQKENLLFSEPSILSVEYLLGFFETDNSLQILLEKDARMTFGYYIRPVAVFFTTASITSEVCCSSRIFRSFRKQDR